MKRTTTRHVRVALLLGLVAPLGLLGALRQTAAADGTTYGAIVRPTTPPKGWNSWNHFACGVTAGDVKRAADAMHSNGMQDAGYSYVNVDDCWMATDRDASGQLQPSRGFLPVDDATGNPNRWTTMKQVADYVHGLGLKFGLYEAGNTVTCAGRAGSLGHEATDAATFVAWGVDFLKYDSCRGDSSTPRGSSTQQSKTDDMNAMKNALVSAIGSSSHKILYSINPLSGSTNLDELESPFPWNQISDMSRVVGDIGNTWAYIPGVIGRAVSYAANQKTGYYNDADMLEIGNLGIGDPSDNTTLNEDETQMVMWSMLQSPLIQGSDFTHLSTADLALINNSSLLALDDLGGPALTSLTGSDVSYLNTGSGSVQFYVRNAPDGSKYVAAFNNSSRGAGWATVTIKNSALGLGSSAQWTPVTGLSDYMASYPSSANGGQMYAYVAEHATGLWHVTP